MKMTAQQPTQLNQIISVFLLIVLLCSVKAHAEHFELLAEPADKTHCQICQQNIDQPQNLVVGDIYLAASFVYLSNPYQSILPSNSYFDAPQLRAPPHNLSI